MTASTMSDLRNLERLLSTLRSDHDELYRMVADLEVSFIKRQEMESRLSALEDEVHDLEKRVFAVEAEG